MPVGIFDYNVCNELLKRHLLVPVFQLLFIVSQDNGSFSIKSSETN